MTGFNSFEVAILKLLYESLFLIPVALPHTGRIMQFQWIAGLKKKPSF